MPIQSLESSPAASGTILDRSAAAGFDVASPQVSASVRLRPILLTSGVAALGTLAITLDTVFGGMALPLCLGLIASTMFSLLPILVTHYVIYANKSDLGLPDHVRRTLVASLGQESSCHEQAQ